MIQLQHFCYMQENFFKDASICDKIIENFESNSSQLQVIRNSGKPDFTQLELKGNEGYELEAANAFADLASKYVSYYENEAKLAIFPKNYQFEGMRVKSYSPENNERFDYHVDAISKSSSTRFLAMFVYLNDVEEGGETVFPTMEFKVKPKKNTLFMFPPLWMYPHSGQKPISGKKYILSTYLHFV